MKKLHTASKIFFPKPYVVRVEYTDDIPYDDITKKYSQTCRSAYKLIQGTWGHSTLTHDVVKVKKENKHVIPPMGGFNGLNVVMIGLVDDYRSVYRGYFCFKEEIDALQFRLSIDTTSRQVVMWPELTFTIHELVETDES